MIQRIQSIFLLIASGGFFSLFGLPFAKSDKAASPLFQDQLFNIHDHILLLILTVLGGIITLSAIFLFKNRLLQKRLGLIGIISAILVGTLSFWLMFDHGKQIDHSVEISDQAGLIMPAVSLVMVALANYFINKDDKLVSSMDRLR